MCGICGVRRFGPEPITEDQLTILLCANQDRGMHATGLALQQPDGQIQVLKQKNPAWEFVTSDEYRAFIDANLHDDTIIALGHTRHATKGNPEDTRNNHPLWNGHSAVVHNGMLNNDDQLFSQHHLERVGQVDSDILRAIVDRWGMNREGIGQLQKVNGSCALAAMSVDFPGKLILGRSGSPLVLGSTPSQLVWSSEKAAIHAAMRPLTMRFGFPMQPNRTDLAWMTMTDQSIYLLGELQREGEVESCLEWHDKFDTAKYYNKPIYRPHDNYLSHVDRFDIGEDKHPNLAWCADCKVFVTIEEAHKKLPLWELFCLKCGTWLADAPKGTSRPNKAKLKALPA